MVTGKMRVIAMKSSISIWIFVALLATIVLCLPVSAYAQSCALCYTQAAGSGSKMIQALKSGILILIAPPTLGSVGLIFVCYRKRNQTRREASREAMGDWGDEQSESAEPREW
jgi:hypothetical protein